MKLQNNNIDLISLFNEIEQIFKHKTREKKIDFILQIDNSVPKSVVLDGVRLRQILFNLVGNAVKFTNKGFVKLSVKTNEKLISEKKTGLHISVQDSGIGIPNEQLENIFGAFEQQSNQDYSKYGGTGLGLTITQRLVKMMDGNIDVESETGKGSIFHVKLNNLEFIPESEVTRNEVEDDHFDLTFTPSHLLVVDDVVHNRKLVKSYLKKFPIEVMEAENGKVGVEKANTFNPDIILMDLKMPEMDGFEALSALKSDEKTSSIPVIAFTASAMKDEKENILKKGFNEYLSKPFSEKDLMYILKKFLNYELVSQKNDEELKEEPQPEINDNIKDLLELLNLLNGQYFKKWEEISDTIILDDISEFANEIKTIAQQYEANRLSDWSKNVLTQIDSFDIESLPGSMEEFKKITIEYQGLYNQNMDKI